MSLELDEVIDLSDVIAVIHDGRITGIVNSHEVNENLLGLMMAGLSKEEAMKQLQENKTEAK